MSDETKSDEGKKKAAAPPPKPKRLMLRWVGPVMDPMRPIGIDGIGEFDPKSGLLDLGKWMRELTVERSVASIVVEGEGVGGYFRAIAYLPPDTQGKDDELRRLAVERWTKSNALIELVEV